MNFGFKNRYRALFFFALIFFNMDWAIAQQLPACCPHSCPPGTAGQCHGHVPISGIEILLAGGAALGIRKLIQNKRSKRGGEV